MRKLFLIFAIFLGSSPAWAQLTAPTITATVKGPDQINLTWSAASSPGYGYLVEIQSSGDARYSSYTQWVPIPNASGDAGDLNSDPTCTYCFQPQSNGLPTWVVESQYVDPIDGGSAAQAIIYGLIPNTLYNFRVRTYAYYKNTIFSSYSTPASATTSNYTLRYVNAATGNDSNNGTNSTTLAWLTIDHACKTATSGQAVIIIAGNYANDDCGPTHSGTSGVGNHIVFMANPGDVVTITSTAAANSFISISSTISYIVFDGLKSIATITGGGPLNQVSGNFIAFFGMDLDSKNQDGTRVYGDHNLFQGNYLHDVGNTTVDGGDILFIDGLAGGTYTASNNIIQYNHLTRGSHGNTFDLCISLATSPNHNQFMNNIADGGWGNAFSSLVQQGAPVGCSPQADLFEGNIAAYMFQNTSTPFKEGYEDLAGHSTWRRNMSINGAADALEFNAFRQSVTNALYYNNIFYKNIGRCWWNGIPAASQVYTGDNISNTICLYGGTRVGNELGNLQYFYHLESDMILSHNDTLYYSGGVAQPSQATIMYNVDGTTLNTVAYEDSNNNPPFSNNAALQVVPSFVDSANYDFHQLSGSPTAGVGTTITDANWGTISNTNLGVFDGSFATPSIIGNSMPAGVTIKGVTVH